MIRVDLENTIIIVKLSCSFLYFIIISLLSLTSFKAFSSSYCYQVKKALNVVKNVNGRKIDCGVLSTNDVVRKAGSCSRGWCQMLTPNQSCNGWGWIFVGKRGENAVRYECPQGRRVEVSTRLRGQSLASASSAQRGSVAVRGSGEGELSAGAPSLPSISGYRGPGIHSPNRARRFEALCLSRGINKKLCREMLSPNTNSQSKFRAVYGSSTPFYLLPDESRWEVGLKLLKAVQDAGGCVNENRNWYRPEPYNAKVGGAKSSQHKSASALDINYCSLADKNKALAAFKRLRSQTGFPKGIGTYYCKSNKRPTNTIHIDYVERDYSVGVNC